MNVKAKVSANCLVYVILSNRISHLWCLLKLNSVDLNPLFQRQLNECPEAEAQPINNLISGFEVVRTVEIWNQCRLGWVPS
jgi:hypothetical protein